MGEYADVKRKKIRQALNKLAKIEGFEVGTGGNHQWIIKHISWKRPFPITFKNNKVSKVYIKELIKIVVETDSCTEDDIKSWLK